MILCVDSSSRFLSFALATDVEGNRRLVGTASFDVGGKMNENVITLLDDLLSNNHIKIDQISKIVVITGPGSFTGIRIGLAALGGIATAMNIEFKGLSSLDAAAVLAKSDSVSVAAKLKLNEYAIRQYNFVENIFSDVIIVDKSEIDSKCVVVGESFALHSLPEAISDVCADNFLQPPAPLYVRKSEAEINFDKKSLV
ncbi:MAG: tRNA (adenosine(37)-N6)-threonylcarbamoyltransferase complex dimerization subunit type 1 TsaB [Deferribacteraceae bacterium]|jgi:tRNA threonylcarbamoyl adenosine modification protein YeaZ|nr:tRNA (adenosine(37)-N6)-threonylcarbamoyltransferase complex dimerization subunit type 1 TsaB [Deferribacteraceae bacterium]